METCCVPPTHSEPPFHTWTTLTQTAPVAGAFGRQAERVLAGEMAIPLIHSTALLAPGFRDRAVQTVGVRWSLRGQPSVDGACK